MICDSGTEERKGGEEVDKGGFVWPAYDGRRPKTSDSIFLDGVVYVEMCGVDVEGDARRVVASVADLVIAIFTA